MSRILLVNPNSSEKTTAAMTAMARAEFTGLGNDGVEILPLTVAAGPPMLVDEPSLQLAADQTVSAVEGKLADDADIDGVIVAAFGDPGADELRSRLAVPVIGIGESAIRRASDAGPFSIATTTPLLEGSIRAQVECLGADGHLTSIVITPGDPLTLAGDQGLQTTALGHAVAQGLRDGARSVIIAGGPLAASADELSARFDVPIINPVRAACERMLVLHDPGLSAASD